MKPPTPKELRTARKVLKFYESRAAYLANKTGQEKPVLWALGCELWIELLEGDPHECFQDYEQEYDLGHR